MTSKERKKANERHKRWRDANRTHLLEYGAKRRILRREFLAAYDRAYYAEHREDIRIRQVHYQRAYRRNHRRELAAKQRQRIAAQPTQNKKRLAIYRSKNKAMLTAYAAETRRLKKYLPGITMQQFNKLKRMTKG